MVVLKTIKHRASSKTFQSVSPVSQSVSQSEWVIQQASQPVGAICEWNEWDTKWVGGSRLMGTFFSLLIISLQKSKSIVSRLWLNCRKARFQEIPFSHYYSLYCVSFAEFRSTVSNTTLWKVIKTLHLSLSLSEVKILKNEIKRLANVHSNREMIDRKLAS